MKPLIGINCDFELNDKGKERSFLYAAYYDAVARAGAVPVLIPALEDPADLDLVLERLDGVLLSGGDDFDPCHYGAKPHPSVKPLHCRRQSFDLTLGRRLAEHDLPVLGVCCGAQLMAIVAGGTLYEDVPSQVPDAIPHRVDGGGPLDHPVRVAPGTRLGGILEGEVLANSAHHQSVRCPGRLSVSAVSPDGLIEALEDPGRRFYVGVQWHPERIAERPAGGALIAAFVEAARQKRP